MLPKLDLSCLNPEHSDDESKGYLLDEDELDQVKAEPSFPEVPATSPTTEGAMADTAEETTTAALAMESIMATPIEETTMVVSTD